MKGMDLIMKKLKEEFKYGKKGITLISLVVTIIVLLILAGVTIATLTGDNGILTRTQNAKNQTEEAKEDELRKLTALEAATNIENQPYTDKNGDTATIPAWFAVSQVEGEQDINTGLVIIDTKGNEFVWIPVLSENEYKRNFNYPSYYDNYSDTTPLNSTYTDTGYLPDEVQPEIDNSQNNENAEKESVLKNKGFYVARYESGKENNKVVSKRFSNVWNNINYSTAKIISKTMYNTNTVKSALCSGIQWDMIMKFVDGNMDANNSVFYVKEDNLNRHIGSLSPTGYNLSDKVKNIYDLEGNCSEWVAEKCSINAQEFFINRRGIF